MSATTAWTCDNITFICDDCGQRFGAAQASSSYEATRCIPCHKTHVANVYRAYDERLSAFGEMDEPDGLEPLTDAELDDLEAENNAIRDAFFAEAALVAANYVIDVEPSSDPNEAPF